MGFIELFLIGVGLSADAFAVSVCKGLTVKGKCLKPALTAGLWFGAFQAIMPLIGYFLGTMFQSFIEAYDHWIAFVLLALIGANMIKESFSKDDEKLRGGFGFREMFILAVATSIDALAVGISFACLKVNIFTAVALIGVTTFVLSAVGIKIGGVFGAKYKQKATLAGGIILVLIGVKILLEHLGVINF